MYHPIRNNKLTQIKGIYIMQNKTRIPRWFVESDPLWEKSIDLNLHVLKWTKKGTRLQAICHPTDIYCQIIGEDENQPGLPDVSAFIKNNENSAPPSTADDMRKYLSSRYLNSRFNGSRFDLRNTSYL